ncbi:MAG: alpha/beta hydrolase, partial [Acidobacteriota bacterium]|nr:alpha/beta hydrolase [Acidobacteriota bacterium]
MSLGLVALALYLLYRAYSRARRLRYRARMVDGPRTRRVEVLEQSDEAVLAEASNESAVTIPLAIGLALLLFSFGGRHVIQYGFHAGDEPAGGAAGTVQTVQGLGGANLRVEVYGRADAPALLFTHGWSMDKSEWVYARRALGDRFQLIFWDLPGLGESTRPQDGDFALETMARDLREVLKAANGKPVTLVGHSIGGMINLTFCRLFPELLGRDVAGIVQVDTSFTDPVKTT